MPSRSLFSNVAVAALSLIATTHALPTITRKGSKLFTSDGNQFYFKGLAYQNTGADPLMDPEQCALDIPLMKQLGVNAIRVYHVFPSANHDGCMQQLDEAGIYVWVDLDTWSTEPTEFDTVWTPAQMGAYMYNMDAFINYDNLGGFFVGNEIINQAGDATKAAPYIKAMVGDLKAYRDGMGYRPAPIGYSHADVAGLDDALRDYLTCGDEATQIEFFGLNSYRWCGQGSSYDVSGYHGLYDATENFTAPIFFSETGCNVPLGRNFADQTAIMTNMSNVWSGAVIYVWGQTGALYGLVTYGGDTSAYDKDQTTFGDSGTPTPIVPDFHNLGTQWATLHPTGVSAAAYTQTLPPQVCPTYSAGVWEVDPSGPIPTLGLNVAIPTSSALALANGGLANYTTPNLRVPVTPVTSAIISAPATTTAIATTPNPSTSTAVTTPSSTMASSSSSSSSFTEVINVQSTTTISTSSASTSPSPSPSTSTSTKTTQTHTTTASAAITTSTISAASTAKSTGAAARPTQQGVLLADVMAVAVGAAFFF